MKITYLDLKRLNEPYFEEFDVLSKKVIESGCYIGGSRVSDFEKGFAAYCGIDHCVGVANGLDTITLIRDALDIAEGDEVIVPAQTFIATYLPISAVGAKPVAESLSSQILSVPLAEYHLEAETVAIVEAFSNYGKYGRL